MHSVPLTKHEYIKMFVSAADYFSVAFETVLCLAAFMLTLGCSLPDTGLDVQKLLCTDYAAPE